MNVSIVTTRTLNGVEYILYRDNDNPSKTYVAISYGPKTPITVEDFMVKYGSKL